MNKFKSLFSYFSKAELALWISSVALIVISFCIFDRSSYLILAASVIGATSLIFNAKGNAVGQILMVIFSVLYGIVSFSFAFSDWIFKPGAALTAAVCALFLLRRLLANALLPGLTLLILQGFFFTLVFLLALSKARLKEK